MRAKLAGKSGKLDAWQFQALWHSCQAAKERLMGDDAPDSEPVVVPGRGSSLIGGTLRTELTRKEVESVLLDGFLPLCESTDRPAEGSRVGMREMGLPCEADPAITRHLARFLARQVRESEAGEPVGFPRAVLFNGGVMKSPLMRERVLASLRHWQGGTAGEGQGIRVTSGLKGHKKAALQIVLKRRPHMLRIVSVSVQDIRPFEAVIAS